MPVDPVRVKALFLAALDQPDPAARQAFLDRECGEDNELRRRLDELLEAHERSATELERPIAASLEETARIEYLGLASAGSEPTAEAGEATMSFEDRTANDRHYGPSPSTVIGLLVAGRYKIRQEIGQGGMGSVYLAEQIQPVKRRVALKLIKAGMDSKNVLAQFESERQALAMMDHPHIAKVLDAGSTEHGRPFFVMELVKGVSITEYCDLHRLDIPERLALFRQVCSAVQHAHQKGIIHRDLKPKNILVENHDDKPVPKVIDFGLAKATGGLKLTEQSLFTAFGGVAGTPLYMAPEQASFNALDIDTRADIYALGVILYELLTGSTPIRRESFWNAALGEMLRVIREVEPPTPSSRLSSSEALPSVAANRHSEPSRLSRFVRGDLDWIVMKALAKERKRRYDSANDLANDLERFANHEPVSAGPPTSGYRLRKFVRRNRVQVVAGSLVLMALVAGIVGTSLGLLEARRQWRAALYEAELKDLARNAESIQRGRAEAARNAESVQRGRAEARLVKLEKVNEILGSIFIGLNPKRRDKDTRPLAALLGDRLDQATEQIEGEAIGDPLTVARIQVTLGMSQLGLGHAEKAITLFTKARATFTAELGPDNPETLKLMNNLATSYQEAGQLDKALALYEQTLAIQKAKLGPDHHDTINTMGNLASSYLASSQLDRALELQERTLELKKATLGPDHPDTINTMGNLAGAYRAAGRIDRALPLYEQTLAIQKAKLGPDHPDTLIAMDNLAIGYAHTGQVVRALPIREQVLALMKARLGPDHPDTLIAMDNLANGYRETGQIDRALPLLEQAFTLMKAKLGPDHPLTLTTMDNLAGAYKSAGQLDRALPIQEQALALMKVKLGPDHHDTLITLVNLAGNYQASGQPDRSLPIYEQVLAIRKAKLVPDHPEILDTLLHFAEACKAAGQPDRALPILEERLALLKAKLGPDHPDTLGARNNLAGGYRAAGKLDRALPLYESALADMKAKLGPDHPFTLTTMGNLALGYIDAGQLDRALPLQQETLALKRAKLGPDHPDTLSTMSNLASSYLHMRKPELALPLLEQAFEIEKVKLGPDQPQTLITMGNLANCYLQAGQTDRALPLLEQTLALKRARLGREHPDTLVSMGNLAVCYRQIGQLDRALALMEETLAIEKAKLGPEHPTTLRSMNNLAAGYWSAGKLDRSVPLFEETLKLRIEKLGSDHPDTWMTRANLGVNYRDSGRLDEALPLLEEAALASQRYPQIRWVKSALLDGYIHAGRNEKAAALAREILEEARAPLPANSPQMAGLLAQTGLTLLQLKAWTDAEPILRDALKIREAMAPDDWRTINTRSLLGGALLGQKKYDEAEPLLRTGYEGMKQRADKIPPQAKSYVLDALDRLIELAEATGKPDEAKAWREEKAKLTAASTPEARAGEEMSEQSPPDGFFPQVYDELRRLAASKLAREADGHSLDATALVHEAFLRLGDGNSFEGRTEFLKAAAVAMQRILVDHARGKRAAKRGGQGQRFSIQEGDRVIVDDPDTVLDIDEALSRLALEDPTSAEVARFRLFAGLSIDEAAEALGLSRATAFREWAYARSWLTAALTAKRRAEGTR